MKITDLNVREVSVPRIYETHVADPQNLQPDTDHTRSIYQIIELLTDEGPVGLGEISDISKRMQSPNPSEMRDLLAEAMKGTDISNWRATYARVAEALPNTFHPELRSLTLFGVEIALLDLVGKKYNVPLYELLGGRYHTHVDISWVAYLRGDIPLETELGALGEEVREKCAEGFRAFKLKVGEDHERDITRIHLFREIAGPEAYLKVDASGAWEIEEAIQKLKDVANAGANACETPISEASRAVANDNPDQINTRADEVAKSIARVRTAYPIAIIEHVADFDDCFLTALMRHQAVDIVNVIPSQSGGILRAGRLIQVAEAAGVPALLGSTIEMGPGTAAFVHLAIASKNLTVPSALISPGLLIADICKHPFQFKNGTLRPFDSPGLGVELDEGKMEKWQI
ncbi:MAG: hypothetical protein HOE48_02375 [Candidatus Latescibacteria bacterium]|nr:hypothetical protein [Candidatus Latescibacterota bacterium]